MPAPSKLRTQLVLAGAAAYWVVIFVGTHLPGSVIHAGGHTDKVYHFSAFLGLAILLCGCMACFRRPGPKLYAAIVGLIATYAVLDELTQMLVPNRTADPLDWLADLAGAITGTLLFALAATLICPGKKAQGATG